MQHIPNIRNTSLYRYIKYLAHLQITVFNARGDGGGGGFSVAVYSLSSVCGCACCVLLCAAVAAAG